MRTKVDILASKFLVVGECWIWQGWKNKNGYGRLRYQGKSYFAHRFSYEAFKGEIPEGLVIDHLCSNRPCVNPAHLEAVTIAENNLRVVQRGNHRNGRKTHCNQGHEFTPINTYTTKAGIRICKRCRADREKKYRSK